MHVSTILTSVFDTGNTSDFTMVSKDFNKTVNTSEPGFSFLLPINKQKEKIVLNTLSIIFRGRKIYIRELSR